VLTYRRAGALALLTGGLIWGCGGAGAAASIVPGPAGTHASAHFTFHYTTLDAGNVDLIAANGDTSRVLGIPLADFERDWFAFVRERYRL
jgi:hypothetical protein